MSRQNFHQRAAKLSHAANPVTLTRPQLGAVRLGLAAGVFEAVYGDRLRAALAAEAEHRAYLRWLGWRV